MKRVLLTGGSGFVGANLTRRLLEDGHRVHVLVRPQHDPWRIDSIRKHISLAEADLCDRDSVFAVVRRVRPEWVFQLAAYGAYSSQTHVPAMILSDLMGTVNLLDACVATGFESFVNTGSSSEYGFKAHAPTEQELLEPNSAYAVTKSATTHYCRLQAHRLGLRIPTLRLYSVFGPYEEPTRLIPSLIVQGLQRRWPSLADPRIARDFVHASDVCEAYVLAATASLSDSGAVYNVGTGIQTTLRMIAVAAREIFELDVDPPWGSMADRPWDTHVWVSDNRKIRSQLGWLPRQTLRSGLLAMADWFKANPAILSFYKSRQKQELSSDSRAA